MARIYWIGTGLAQRLSMRRRRIYLGLDGRQEDNRTEEEMRYYDEEDCRPGILKSTDRPHVFEFQEVHEWLWPCEARHKEYLATEAGMKQFLNALTYTAGDKSVLAYSYQDLAKSPAFYGTPMAAHVWLTEVARLGATVYFVRNCIKSLRSGEFSDDDGTDKLIWLSEPPSPEAVKDYDRMFGRRSVSRRKR